MQICEYLKTVLIKSGCDCLYVNHTNEFFSEYVDVQKSSRFLLTGFSGSAGDAIFTDNKIYLFVDSRYWEQADFEVDKNLVEVVKLSMDLTFEKAIKKILKPNSKILFYENKTSFQLVEKIEKLGFHAEFTSIDYILDYNQIKQSELKKDFKKIPLSIAGKNTDKKISKIQKKMAVNEVLIVSSLEDVSYLMNMKSSIFEYSSVIFGKIIIEKNGYKFFDSEKDFENEIKKLAAGNVKFYIDKATLSVKYRKYFKNYESAKILSTLRSVKNASEIRHIQKCFEQTDKVINSVYEILNKKDFSEIALYDYVNEKFIEYGAETNSFKTILASGKNSSVVHFSHPTERKIKDGEFILIDCGGLYDGGYATDITRTIVKAKPTVEQKRIYTVVLKAFLNAYNADLEKNKTCFDVDKIARDLINQKIKELNLDGFVFGHGLGHSVGRCVHDGLPTVSPAVSAKTKIKKNMIFTIEPGLYKQNWGGVRLENTICVIKDENKKLRFRSLSKAPFQKSLIDFEMLTDIEKQYLKEWELV